MRVTKKTTFIILYFFAIALVMNLTLKGEQQFVYLADSLLQKKLYFTEKPGTWLDTTYYNGKYYWPLGPLPAVLLTPFVLVSKYIIGVPFLQGYLQILLTIGSFATAFRIAKKIGFTKNDSAMLAFGFFFASTYSLVAMVPWSWYFSHAVAVFLSLLAIHEYLNKKRYAVLGILTALVFTTRITAGFIGILFLLDILLDEKASTLKKIENALLLLNPIVIGGIILGISNYIRFGDPLNSGYKNVILPTESRKIELLNYGLFKIRNIPTNFYYYFIKTLDPVLANPNIANVLTHKLKPPYVKVGYPGTSFFITAPVFLYTFRANLRNRTVKLALIPILITLIVLLSYYWPGWRQTGPRYTLDFLPLLYLVLLNAFKGFELPKLAKVVIVASAFLNLYFLITVFTKI